jgi:hypothetical protein
MERWDILAMIKYSHENTGNGVKLSDEPGVGDG